MTGSTTCRAETRCRRGVVAATALMFAFGFQSMDLRAELLFRSLEQSNGRPQWSALRNYADPAETAYPRTLADGTQVSAEEVQVFLRDHIAPDDVYSAKVMESLIKRGRQKIAGNVVSLAGNGGDVDAAMELGRLLRKLGVATLVAQGEQCLSSCVFAFMGGDQRTVAGRIGIHRPYFSSARKVPDRRAYYRQLQKRLQRYIEELDFPPSLYEALMAVPPESINILTAAELKKFYLQGMSPSAEDEADAAAAGNLGITVTEYLQRKAQGQPCAGVIGGACDAEAQKAAGRSAASIHPRRFPVYDSPPPAPGAIAEQETAHTEGPGATRGAAELPGNSF